LSARSSRGVSNLDITESPMGRMVLSECARPQGRRAARLGARTTSERDDSRDAYQVDALTSGHEVDGQAAIEAAFRTGRLVSRHGRVRKTALLGRLRLDRSFRGGGGRRSLPEADGSHRAPCTGQSVVRREPRHRVGHEPAERRKPRTSRYVRVLEGRLPESRRGRSRTASHRTNERAPRSRRDRGARTCARHASGGI
jgi:hypothetical protein